MIETVVLNTRDMYSGIDRDEPDYELWQRISAYMDGEKAYVIKSRAEEGKYVFLGLLDAEKDKELHYMFEQDSSFGLYIDDREEFDKDWDSGDYEQDGSIYLEPEYIIMLDAGQTEKAE